MRSPSCRRVLRCLSLAAFGVFAASAQREASAITIRNDVPDSSYTSLAAESQYSSVGFVDQLGTSEDIFGSGVLIAPDWVLTAGHVASEDETGPPATAPQMSFGFGASTTPFMQGPDTVSQVDVDPAYNGNSTTGTDLALIQLSTPITNVTPAVLYTSSLGSELTLTATVVGYGTTGTGLTGGTQPSGTLRAMQNVIDAFGGQTVAAGSLAAYSSNILFTDFDSPNTLMHVNVMGSSVPLPLEGGTAPGDSGGGVFTTVNGQTYLTAITDFASNPHSSPNGKYGDYDGYVRVSVPDSVSFLDSILVTTSAWDLAGGGTWASQSSWTGSEIPGFMQSTANFGSAITTPSTVTLDCNWSVGTVTFNNTNSYTLNPGNGGVLTLDNGGATATAAVTDNGGSHFINTPIVLNSNALFTVVNPGDVLTISGPISGSGGVTIAGGGTLRLGSGSGMTTLSALTVQTGATLDITNNALAINYGGPGKSPIAAIVAALTSGYNGGAWTGTGINSSTAAAGGIGQVLSIGYADGNVDANTPAAPNQVLVKFTLAGDANLDGSVDFNDLFIVGQHLNTTGNDWSQGNFNYDPSGMVDFDDLFLIGQNLNQTLSGALAEELGDSPNPLALSSLTNIADNSVVLPEPGLAGLFAVGAGLLLGRRRGRPLPHGRRDGKN